MLDSLTFGIQTPIFMTKRIFALLMIAVLGMSFSVYKNDKLYEISKNIEIFVKVYKELNNNYVDDLDPGKLMRTGIDAMVGSLDPYTNYISESQVESYRINTEGKYQGIGGVVKQIGDYVTIIEPYAKSPLAEAGIIAGDQVISVNGQSTKGKSTEEVTQFVRGVAGTNLNLKIKRPTTGESFDIALERGSVEIPNVPYSGIIRDHVGYISLTTFTPDASKNIRKAFKQLKEDDENLQGIILDLRYNGGGLLREAINICNIFIEKGEEIVFTRGKVKERDRNFPTTMDPLDLEIPLVVMINKNSASASEIVSGVIQDLDRGVILGQRSFGKGLVQNTMELGYNSRIKLTTSKYYIPSGRCIQGKEYEDGEPVNIPDSERAEFKTRNGRPVLDGGGVTPDVKLDAPKVPVVLEKLKEQDIIFNYVTNYVNGKTPGEEVETIVFTDFEDFKSYVEKQDFKYETNTEKTLLELRESFKNDGYSDLLESDLKALEVKINSEKMGAIVSNKKDIINAIQEDISSRFYLQKGKAFQKLADDYEINEAVNILTDEAKYKSFLK